MYPLILCLAVVAAALVVFNRKGQSTPSVSQEFTVFQLKYLLAYFMATFADWCQGPYVYRLYAEYNFSIGQIGTLFILGFLSSAVFGTSIGSLADKFGRKKVCLLYCLFYMISCATKHVNDFYVLALGRVTGGISTSILYSTFESWMVNQHDHHHFPSEWRGYTFYIQVLGNGIVAILAGLLSNFLTEFTGQVTAPFDAAFVFCVLCAIVIAFYWDENYGDQQGEMTKSFVKAYHTIIGDKKILLLGLAQSFFESAMFVFVFMWSPCLEAAWGDEPLQHGLVFTSFMIAVMIGSAVFQLASSKYTILKILFVVFQIASGALSVPVFFKNGSLLLAGMLVFEACVGIFWPGIGTLKAQYIPEDVRSTVMNYFRLPTNFFVLATLHYVEQLSTTTVFSICSGLITASTGATFLIQYLEKREKQAASEEPSDAQYLVMKDEPLQPETELVEE